MKIRENIDENILTNGATTTMRQLICKLSKIQEKYAKKGWTLYARYAFANHHQSNAITFHREREETPGERLKKLTARFGQQFTEEERKLLKESL